MTYYGNQYCHNRTPSHTIISMIPPSPVLGPGLGGIMDLGLGGIMDSSTVIIVGLAKEIPGDRRCKKW